MAPRCPECGYEARTSQGLAGHLRLAHGSGTPSSRQSRDLEARRRLDTEGPVLDSWPFVMADAHVFQRTYQMLVDRLAERLAARLWEIHGEEVLREFVARYEEELRSAEGLYKVMKLMLPRLPQEGLDVGPPGQDP